MQVQIENQTELRGEEQKEGFTKAKTTKCNSFMQMKDYWLGEQGLQMRKQKLQG